MDRLRFAFLVLSLCGAGLASAQPRPSCPELEAGAFSALPMVTPAGRGDRGRAVYCLANLRATEVEVRSGADAGSSPGWTVPVEGAGFALAARKLGNYHWLQARTEGPEGIITAAAPHYFANPGPAPPAMLQARKAELEIVPMPLPREHWKYRAGETWDFLLRFQGRPLPHAKLRLETSGGTQQVLGADEQGVVRVVFPDDFATDKRPGHAGHGGRAENRFVLAMGHTDLQGRYFLSTFSYKYGEPADQGKSYWAGAGFLLLGGLMGLPLALSRRKETAHD